MMTADDAAFTTDFAAEFRASEAEWRTAAEAALKGRALDSVLRGKLVDGVAFAAIAPRASARPIAGRAAGARWIAMTRIDIADPAAANAQALEDLNNGAAGLSIALASGEGGPGLVADTLDRLDRALEDVLLDLAPIHLDSPPFGARPTAALVAALVERRGLNPADARILFGLDMLGDPSRTGALALSWDRLGARSASTVKALLARGFASPILMMDQRIAHEAGASEAQELAGALSSAVEHIRAMTANGLDAAQVADTMSFAFACDADQFAVIAKLRAARLLWAAVRRELGLADRPVHIHAETSRRMMARKDPQTNIVRSTVAAFAAGVGGADSVLVLPYTDALGGADANARRIARNAQAIVLEESNAYRVADPAAGAGAIEALTDAIAERAWDLFRETERGGGMLAAMTGGAWQERIAETRRAREKLVAARKIAIVGVSEFPKADEAPPIAVEAGERHAPAPSRGTRLSVEDASVEDFSALVAAFADGTSTADAGAGRTAEPAISVAPLAPKRLAEDFERLRDVNEADEPRPAVFLALLGPIARHSARAGFIRNLMTAGGLASVEGPIETDTSEVVRHFKQSGARLAVICGADADYEAGAADVTGGLKAGGATVWLAGRPKDGRDALESAGVARFVAAGDDAFALLTEATAISAAGAEAQGGAS
jgi:methylmalonyl-CoA mutase